MRVKITLHPHVLERAIDQRIRRGIAVPEHFEGPEFADVEDCGTDAVYLKVKLEAGTVYLYPHTSIARVAFYPE